MRGIAKPVSLARRIVIDFLNASVPLVIVKRTMKLDRLVAARAQQAERPGWVAIVAKAFCIVARDEPWLRTFYLRWPWPHFYEVPESTPVVAITRDDIEKDAIVFLKIGRADTLSLIHVELLVRHGKTAPLDDIPSVRKLLRIARWPLPFRRLAWTLAMNIGRQRANHFGTFGITSIASLGSELVVVRAPGPSTISYGIVRADNTMELSMHWDHRIYDGILAARTLQRLEDVMNTAIADELLQPRL